MLTGDKVETAINIGFSSKLLKPQTTLIKITEGTDRDVLKEQLRRLCKTFHALTSERGRNVFLRMMHRLNNSLGTLRQGLETGIEHVGRMFGATPSRRNINLSNREEEDGQGELALVVTGEALEIILADDHLSHMLMDLGRICDSVVACRVSPSQKAQIVDLVHRLAKPDSETPPMTLSIGDGANDVGMIQEAQIGVGISGHEGLQAVNNSDFAIGQFRFMKRLLLVHGRWNYRRSAKVFLYSFFKNVVLVITLFAYLPPSLISGQTLYESMVYAGYNFFLGWPIIGVGMFDRDISVETVLRYPELYISGRLNLDLRTRKMFSWVVMAVIHSIFIYFIPLFTFTRLWHPDDWPRPHCNHTTFQCNNELQWVDIATDKDGEANGMYVLGTATYACLIAAMHWKVTWHTYSWTWINVLYMLGFSIPLLATFMIVYSNWLNFAPQFYGVAAHVFFSYDLWLAMLLVLTCIAIVEYVKERLRLQFFPTATDIAMQLDRGYIAQQQKHEVVCMNDVDDSPHVTPMTSPFQSPILAPVMEGEENEQEHYNTDGSSSTDEGGGNSVVPILPFFPESKINASNNSRSTQLRSASANGGLDPRLFNSEPFQRRGSPQSRRTSRRVSRVDSRFDDTSRRSRLNTAVSNVIDLDSLGVSVGRSRLASSFAYDHPSRDIGR